MREKVCVCVCVRERERERDHSDSSSSNSSKHVEVVVGDEIRKVVFAGNAPACRYGMLPSLGIQS